MLDRAGWPLSNHHFRLSEDAGGSPGEMGSYPIKSSSSVSISWVFAVVEPTWVLLFSYICRLKDSRRDSSTMLTVHRKVAKTGR